MNIVRCTAEIARAQALETARSGAALFWMLAFPLLFLLVFGTVMARGDARAATHMMPGLFTSILLAGTLFGLAVRLTADRDHRSTVGGHPGGAWLALEREWSRWQWPSSLSSVPYPAWSSGLWRSDGTGPALFRR